MVWSIDDPFLDDMNGHTLPILETYLYYDGPVIFLTKIGLEKYLVSKIDNQEDGYLLIASSIESKILDLLIDNRLSILGALRSGDFIVIDTTFDFKVKRYWPTDIDNFDSDLLPDSGEPLSFEIDRVADTVGQATAYFSVRLFGDSLDNSTMSFHHFKKMVDKAYASMRNILAPNELRSSKSYTYDFKITQPEFGSLIINIDKPSYPTIDKARDVFNIDNIDINFVSQKFLETKSNTMTHLAALKEASKNGIISDPDMAKFSFFIRDISALLPDRNDLYENIEFFSQADEEQKFILLEEKEIKSIRESYAIYKNKPNDIVGRISIINEGSRNVVLKVVGTNELTCNFSYENFNLMKKDVNFKTGNLLTVNGIVKERKRRDFMLCNNAGIVSLRGAQQVDIFE